MSAKSDCALQFFDSGFSCSSAILASFCEKYGMDKTQGLKIACGLGGGAKSAEICGAASGALLVIGLKYGQIDADDKQAKTTCSEKCWEFLAKFKKKNKHLRCYDFLGCDVNTPEGKAKSSAGQFHKTICNDIVKNAAAILEELGY